MIAAILRAQWLSMRLGASRGKIFSLITGILWYGFWCFVAYGIYSLARMASPAGLRLAVPSALLAVSAYWQIIPVLSGTLGSALDLRKLLIYPAPHNALFTVEVLLRLTTGAEMILVLIGGASGLLNNPVAACRLAVLAPAIFIYMLFNLLLASGLRSLMERLLSRRHIREVLVFLMFLALTAPRLLIATGVHPRSAGWMMPLIQWPVLPWAATAHIILGKSWAISLLALIGWTAAAGWFGRGQFEENLRYDPIAAQASLGASRRASPASSWSERLFRLPSIIFRDPLAAFMEKELRSLIRTPRFRMIFVMGFSFGVVIWLPFVLGRQRSAAVEQNFLVIICVYAITLLGQVTCWNSFGFDRSAVQIYFAVPQPVSLVLAAKNLAALLLMYLEVFILAGLTLVLRIGVGLTKVIEALLVTGICTLYMLAVGNISSVQYPRPLKPERIAQGGASGRFQSFMFLLYPLTLLPVFLAYLARYAFQSQIAFSLILAFAAILGGVVYWIAMDSAVNAAIQKREQIIHELSRDEGPVTSG